MNVCECRGMQECLRGYLTDLVSKSEVGQNVNQSWVEQLEREWISNHANQDFFLLNSPGACSSCAAALGRSGSVGRGVCGVEAG